MSLNESIVEDAALMWFGELGYSVGRGVGMDAEEAREGVAAKSATVQSREPKP